MDDTKDDEMILKDKDDILVTNGETIENTFKEIYIDGILKNSKNIDGKEGSYGIFIHSLALTESNDKYLTMPMNEDAGIAEKVINGDMLKYSRAANLFTKAVGIDKSIIEATAPKVDEIPFGEKSTIKASTHLINDKMRVVSYGEAVEMLKKCKFVVVNSKPVRITRKIYKTIYYTLEDMLFRGLNVYALAIKDISIKKDVKGYYRYSKDYSLVAFMGI